MNTSSQYGPDRATYRHWLDRESKPVIGAAAVLREFRRKFGCPSSMAQGDARRVYVWMNGFDRHAVTIYAKSA